MRHLTFTKPSDFLRERNFSQKIEASFDFIRVHARPLARVLITLVLPLALLTGIGLGLMQGELLSSVGSMARRSRLGRYSDSLPAVFTSPSLWLTLLGSMLLLAMLHLVVYGYIVLQAEPNRTGPVTPTEVWQLVKARFLGLVGSYIGLIALFMVSMMVMGALLGLISVFFGAVLGATWAGIVVILGLYAAMGYVMVTLSLYFVVWLRERRGFFGSIKRCFELIWGKWWSTFGLLVVMFIMLWLILVLVLVALSMVGLPFTELMSGQTTEVSPLVRVLFIAYSGLQTLLTLAFYPLLMTAISFQYFNLVERHDGEGTRLLLDSLGEAAPVTTPLALRPDDEGEY
ncbi:hypothetical protein [Hymenobacter pini]|uniref:hypothetical protein n=1 Tax=Hymenobacter pini TaxID=2880879 RepID=UPI001CF53DD3|nr:hypothetical protein [Hymenobacter pini]MCA8831269.1 hypothetical protein [Hymenobacter pini]